MQVSGQAVASPWGQSQARWLRPCTHIHTQHQGSQAQALNTESEALFQSERPPDFLGACSSTSF